MNLSVRSWLALSLLALALVGMISLGRQAQGEAPSVYVPSGYYERVADLIEAGVVRHEADATLPWGRLVVDQEQASEDQQAFLDSSSRLQRDVADFNADGVGVSLWAEAGEVRQSKRAHHFALPYPQRQGWAGTLAFAGGSNPVMICGDLFLEFDEAEWRRDATGRRTLAGARWMGSADGGLEKIRAQGYDLLSQPDQGALLRFDRQGEEVVMECVESKAEARIFLNGEWVNAAGQASGGGESWLDSRGEGLPVNFLRLEAGDRIRVDHAGRSTVLRYAGRAGRPISRVYWRGQRKLSRVDPEIAEQLPWIGELHQAILNQSRSARSRGLEPDDRDYEVALLPEWQARMEDRLGGFLEDFDTRWAELEDCAAQPAAMSLIDARNGQVLVMASYPSHEKLEHLLSEGKIETGRADRLKRNQNMQPVVVGSTTKPIFASAVWQTFPRLRGLTVEEGGGKMDEVHGLPIRGGFRCSRVARRVGSRDFLAHSSNVYAVGLYAATLAEPGSWRLGTDGALLPAGERGIDYSRFIKNGRIIGGLDRADMPAHVLLREGFDLRLSLDHGRGYEQRFDDRVFGSLLQDLGCAEGEIPVWFPEIMPVKANLQLARVDKVKEEMVPILLGGFTNRWSLVDLAEAYARLGTGKKVEAWLLREKMEKTGFPFIGTYPEEIGFDEMPLDRKVLQMVEEGMHECVNSGTAKSLKPALAKVNEELRKQGRRLEILGKTGTAGRTLDRECALFAFHARLVDVKSDQELSAISGAIYLQDRAKTKPGFGTRNSGVAVRFCGQVLPDLVRLLEARVE